MSATVAPYGASSGWKNLERLQELNDAVSIVGRQPFKRLT